MAELNMMQEIVLLMRGFFSMPVITTLSRLGTVKTMVSRPYFTVDDFADIPNKKLLTDSFRYLVRIGLMEYNYSDREVYKVSELGKQLFQRASSFYVPHSYSKYMYYYKDQLLDASGGRKQKVDRLQNVIGSGKTHQRYFPPTVSFLKRHVEFDFIADIGCGDGYFLSTILKSIPGKKAVGIDISQTAIDVTYSNLSKQYPNQEINMICSNAVDINKWAKKFSLIAGGAKVIISMWFLIHEISNNNPDKVIDYLSRVHAFFPKACLIIGELVRHPDEALVKHRIGSIMPEYLFFHEISGQGILSWSQYQKILNSISYKLLSERLFDEIKTEDGKTIPSSFVWCLWPK